MVQKMPITSPTPVFYGLRNNDFNHKNNGCSDRIPTFGIRSIYSPAKVGIGCYKAVNYQPGS